MKVGSWATERELQGIFSAGYNPYAKTLEGSVVVGLWKSIPEGYGALAFGSRVTGLALDTSSDIDVLCFRVRDERVERTPPNKKEALEILKGIQRKLNHMFGYDTAFLIANAKVPIVKAKISGISVDFSASSRFGTDDNPLPGGFHQIKNSVMIKSYVMTYPKLFFLLKKTISKNKLNVTSEGHLSSYGYCLVMIKFLQERGFYLHPELFRLCLPQYYFRDNIQYHNLTNRAEGYYEYHLHMYRNGAEIVLEKYHRENLNGIPDLTSDHFAQWLEEKNFFESGLELNDPFIDYDVARGKTFYGRQLASAFEVVEPASSPPATEPVAKVLRVKPRSPSVPRPSISVPEPSAEVLKEFYEGLPFLDWCVRRSVTWKKYRCPWPKCGDVNNKLAEMIKHANWHAEFMKYGHVKFSSEDSRIQQELRYFQNMSDEDFEAKASKCIWRLLVESGRDPTAKMVDRCYDS